MFTGIIEERGEISAIEHDTGGRRLTISTSFADKLEHGQSVAVSGACLTVEQSTTDTFSVFLSEETIERTYFNEITIGAEVNLERALAADGRLDGHIVQGHVDGVGRITRIEQIDEDWVFKFSLPNDLPKFAVRKGSIAIDGISLTIADLEDTTVSVAIIPATYDLTTLSSASAGDPVHIEVDVIAKYVERLLEGYQ